MSIGCRTLQSSGWERCCAVFCGGVHFPVLKSGTGCWRLIPLIRPRRFYLPDAVSALAGVLTILIGSVLARQMIYPRKQSIGRVLWLSMLQTVLQYLFFYVGLAHTSGVKASIIEAVNVFAAILVASLIFHQERLTRSKMLGCAVGFLGVILVNLTGMNLQFQFQGEGFIFFVHHCLRIFLCFHETLLCRR